MEGPLAKELDFENEGRNSERCASDLKHLAYVYVPEVKWNMTSKVRLLLLHIWYAAVNRITSRYLSKWSA